MEIAKYARKVSIGWLPRERASRNSTSRTSFAVRLARLCSTGRQPFRSGIVDVLRPDSPIGMPASEITLAQALKARGYATQAVGKWHLGDRREFLPCQHGFDHYFGMPCSMDMLPSMLCRDNDLIDNLTGDKVDTITVRYADEAIQFLETTRGRPFFLYLAHTIPHQPVNLPERLKTPGRSIYYDAIEHMDRETGRVIETIDRLGLRENTRDCLHQR